jgi:hypothetical protein
MEELKEEQNITDNENVPLVKKKRVINAPRSEKQIEAFKKAQLKRDENREKMKKEKEVKMAQIYFENKLKQENEKPKEIEKPKEKQISKKPVMKYEESESESEEEIIYVKKKPPKQKNKKIVYLSDDEEDEPPMPTPKKTSRILRNEPQQKPVNNIQPTDFNNFFI